MHIGIYGVYTINRPFEHCSGYMCMPIAIAFTLIFPNMRSFAFIVFFSIGDIGGLMALTGQIIVITDSRFHLVFLDHTHNRSIGCRLCTAHPAKIDNISI